MDAELRFRLEEDGMTGYPFHSILGAKSTISEMWVQVSPADLETMMATFSPISNWESPRSAYAKATRS